MSNVIFKFFVGFVLVFCSGAGFAQLGGAAEKSAMKDMEKHRWQKAEAKLRKALAKDTLNPSIRYLLSVFYFDADNPAYNLDSAYRHVVGALDDYGLTAARERERLRKIFIDSLRLTGLRAEIDSTAFERAKQANTEDAYLKFLSDFPSALQRDLAARLRDEVAFQDALRENTHQAFLRFLNRYPEAEKAQQARAHYDRLLFEEGTRDRRLGSYERFLADHPETPYRAEIYKHIFELSTADGSVESFLDFMTRYPVSELVKRAGQIVFYILADQEDPQWPRQFLNDSLQNLLIINKGYLVPVLKNDLYGFIDGNGREVIPPLHANIHPDYLCGNVTDEVLLVGDKLITRSGSVVYDGPIEGITELGMGFLKIETPTDSKVIHNGGFILHHDIADARIVARSYMAVKNNQGWYLCTLTGRLLDEAVWDDITTLRDVVVFKRDAKFFLATKEEIAKTAEADPLRLSEPFDELKLWPKDVIWGKARDFEGVLNQSLHGVIRFDRHTLTQTFFGAVARLPNGYALYNHTGHKSTTFDRVNIFDPWVVVKKSKKWNLFDPLAMQNISRDYDSVIVQGPFPIGMLTDSLYVHFSKPHVQAFSRHVKISFVPGMDSTSFLLVEEKPRTKSLYDLRGVRLFTAPFDGIEYAGQGIFVITRKDKKGLLNMEGRTLLPAEFDAIGSVKDGVVSLLKNKRFGAYNALHKKYIKPQYERNVVAYTSNVLTTVKGGRYGFLSWDNKPLSDFAFDEVSYWDDSIAMVRSGGLWSFYDIYVQKNTEGNLRNVDMIRNAADEKIAIIQKDKTFGVISNRRKVIIPVTFTDIINLGSADEPLYFTEKHIQEASLYIVIYYDRFGNVLRKEIYEDAAAYDRIYCAQQ